MQYVTNSKDTAFANLKTLKTLVFVDYEAWYWGMFNQHGTVPEVRSWFSDLKEKGHIDEVYFFGDFTQGKMKEERQKLRSITYNIIDCTKGNNEKDYTDFIMLSNIYEKLIRERDKNVQQFVLFTGDGHFQSVVAFLRNFNEKVVGIYAVKGTLNAQLADAADWYVEVVPPTCANMETAEKLITINKNEDVIENLVSSNGKDDVIEKPVVVSNKEDAIKKPVAVSNKNDVIKKSVEVSNKEDATKKPIAVSNNKHVIKKPVKVVSKAVEAEKPVQVAINTDEIETMILESLKHVKESSGSIPSFMKTVGAVCRKNNGLGENAVTAVLSDMITKGKIKQSIVTGSGGYKFKGLEVV